MQCDVAQAENQRVVVQVARRVLGAPPFGRPTQERSPKGFGIWRWASLRTAPLLHAVDDHRRVLDSEGVLGLDLVVSTKVSEIPERQQVEVFRRDATTEGE